MCEEIDWDWVEDAAKNIFNIWVDGSELGWAKEVWEHFGKAGLNQAPGLVEQTKIYLRLVTLGRIYHEFCGCGWDENPDWPIDFFVEHLDVDPLALGILAAKAGLQACDYEDFDDESDLREIALITVSDQMRHEIYEFLKKTNGGDMKLYSSMWRTCRPAQREKGDDDDVDDEDREEDDEEDYDEFAVTGNNMSALNYVQQGFCC